jgi:nickel/cobalt exporter
MRPKSRPGLARAAAIGAAIVLVVVVLDGAAHALLAQNAFGGPRPGAEPQIGGIVGWLLTKQSEFYREMSSTIRAAKSDGSAVWTLLAISFAYGIFHAAGPGHGKAVISSYLVANQETARRGIALSFASALMQSLVAVVIVAVCAWLLNATAKTMCGAEKAIEIASYALIAAFGFRLVWTKGSGFIRALQAPRPALVLAAAAHHHDHGHDHGHRHHDHHHHDDHVHDEHCGHAHGPGAQRTRRSRRLAARFFRDPDRRNQALFRRDPGAGVRAGARLVLGRHRRDLRHGARHRDHGRHPAFRA